MIFGEKLPVGSGQSKYLLKMFLRLEMKIKNTNRRDRFGRREVVGTDQYFFVGKFLHNQFRKPKVRTSRLKNYNLNISFARTIFVKTNEYE